LEKAIELYRNGWSANIICVGGNRSDHKLHGSENSAKYLILEGIPPKNIFYDTLSFDTKSNLIEAYKIVDKNKFHSLIYVSDAVHLLRIESFSKRKSYCLASANYNATFIEKVMFCNQTFASYLFDFILPEYLYLKLIKLYRILN